MSTPTVDLPAQVSGAGEPASAMAGPNTGTVRTPSGPLGTVADSLTFATGTGVWIIGNQRTRTHGIPLVSSTAAGTRTLPSPGAAPVAVATGNAGVRTS